MTRSRLNTLAVVAAVLAPMIVLSGCTASHHTGTAAAGVPRDQTTTPAGAGEVDSVTWNLDTGEPTSLDWVFDYDDSSNEALANMCEGLTRQNEDLSLSPALAQKVDRPDPLTLVFTLRSGVTFWDGNPMTSADVAYSLNRNLDSALGSYWASPFYDNVSSIVANSPTTVTVHFKKPDALFERMMATAAGVIGEKSYIEAKGKQYGTAQGGVMCTGPFQFASWRAGSDITMNRNPAYWDPKLAPKAKQLKLTFITDETTITNSLLAGDIDGAYATPLSATPALIASKSGKFFLGKSTDWIAIRPTEKDGPMHKLAMRHALSDLLDRAAIANAVFRGTATPSLTPIQPGAWGYAADAWKQAYSSQPGPARDPNAAKKLIEDNGLHGATLKIAIPADSQAEAKTAEMLVAAAKKAGFTIDVTSMPMTDFTQLYFDKAARAPYDAFIVQEYGAGVADPIVTMSEFTPLSAYDYGAYDDPVLTESVRSGLQEIDDAARARTLVTGQRRMVEDLPLITIVVPAHRLYMNNRITGATASRAALYYPWAAKIGAPGK